MSTDRFQKLVLGGPGVEREQSVQRIELEEIAMWLARRWSRAAIADATKVILPLAGATGQGCFGLHPRSQFAGVNRNVPDDPMDPGAARGIRVVADQSEAACPLGWIGPRQRRRCVLPVACVVAGDGKTLGEARARQVQAIVVVLAHGSLRFVDVSQR